MPNMQHSNQHWLDDGFDKDGLDKWLGPLSDTTVERAVAILVVSSLGPSRARSAS